MKVQRLAKRLYTTAPASWVQRLRARFRNRFPESEASVHARLEREAYFGARAPFIQQAVERVAEGLSPEEALKSPQAHAFDGKVVEYVYAAAWLQRQPSRENVLDIGCLLRTRFMWQVIRRYCRHVWHCGPVFDHDALDGTAAHFQLFDFARTFPNQEAFSLASCLGCLEHVGYASSLEGPSLPVTWREPALDPVEDTLGRVARLVAAGGQILVSLPFGTREVSSDVPGRHVPGQVFDRVALERCLNLLVEAGFTTSTAVYVRSEAGWERGDQSQAPGPGAPAVVFVEGARKG